MMTTIFRNVRLFRSFKSTMLVLVDDCDLILIRFDLVRTEPCHRDRTSAIIEVKLKL